MIGRIFKTGTIFFVMLAVILGVAFLYLSERATESTGDQQGPSVNFEMRPGESIVSLAERLEEAGLIESRYAFLAYVVRHGFYRSLQAGTYAFSGKMPLSAIVTALREGKVVPPGVRVTFPEGWTITQMAERLTANKLPGDVFKMIASDPFPKWRERFPFLREMPAKVSLEGYLFPDTYIFPEQSTGELIVGELLENFGKRVTPAMIEAARAKELTLHQLMTLASIVEAEVRTPEDRRMVADLFLRRLKIGLALQSDATLRYILGENKIKYSLGETQVISPYNTYRNGGLPPGPIGNPSLEAIEAVLDPIPNDFLFFLNNAETGATVFSRTFEEHVINKEKNGL